MAVSIRPLIFKFIILTIFICSMNVFAEKKMETDYDTGKSIINIHKNKQSGTTIDELRKKIEELENRIDKLEEKNELRIIPLSL